MNYLTFLSPLLATTLAVPSFSPRAASCPANTVQPDGSLPKGSISTSALVPISAKNPNTAYPASDTATITPNDFCTIFNLELDANTVYDKTCNLVFDFPSAAQAPGLFTFSGSGKFTFTGYMVGVGAEPGTTTYNNQPLLGPSPINPPQTMTPGHSYVVNSLPCAVPPGLGQVTVSGSLCSKDTSFSFKQSNGACPLGFYVILSGLTDFVGTNVAGLTG